MLGQVNITELINCDHKFGYYDWSKLDEVLISSQLTLSGRDVFFRRWQLPLKSHGVEEEAFPRNRDDGER